MSDFDKYNLQDLNDRLCGIVLDLTRSYQILKYFRFYSTENEKAIKEKAISRHGVFFHTVDAALYRYLIVTIDNLVDSKSHGLVKYLNKCKQELKSLVSDKTQKKHIAKEIFCQKDSIDRLEFLKGLRTRRDKVEAHFDKEYVLTDRRVDEEAAISMQNLEELIVLFQEILNRHRENIFKSGALSWPDINETTVPYYVIEAMILTEKLRESDATEFVKISENIRKELA